MDLMTNHNILLSLFSQTDWLSKAIMLLLCSLSVVSLTLFLMSYYSIRIMHRQVRAFRKYVISLDRFDLFETKKTAFAQTFLEPIFIECEKISQFSLENNKSTKARMQTIQVYIEQFVQDTISKSERFLPILKVTTEMGPLMGLFGTVWGLIHAFGHIGQAKTVDIATIAPGIAEALIVTLTGLCVAIPALVLYAILVNGVKYLEHELYASAESLLLLIDMHMQEKSKEASDLHVLSKHALNYDQDYSQHNP